MGIFFAVVVCIAIVGIAEPKSQNFNGEERDVHKLLASLEKRVLALEQTPKKTENDNPAGASIMNDTNLEERVQALEFQMENVHEDITVIGGEISVINSEQDLQDTHIQQIENDITEIQGGLEVITGTVTELTAVTGDLQVSVVSLQETDAGLVQDISQLNEVDISLDSRLSGLEVDGTFAFHAALGLYTPIPWLSVVVFPIVKVNLGNGYDGETGDFVTPVGGAGLYFFYVHFQVDQGEHTLMDIKRNGVTLCQMAEADGNANGWPGSSCGATVVLEEGKRNIYCPIFLLFS